jgi:hydroxyacylglutathione hydrolase
LPFDQKMILVADAGKERESIIRLARVGFDKIEGYLEGGFEAWQAAGEPIDIIIDVEPDELLMDLPFDENIVVLDVRKETEYADGHIKDAVNIPLNTLTDPATMANIEDVHNVYVHCAGGYRSVIAASMMKRQGIHNLRNVSGGWGEIKKLEKFEIEKNVAALN